MPKVLKEPGGVAAKVEKLIKPSIEDLGLRLWDVRFEKEGNLWFLKVFIDRDEPLDTDTCELASKAIDPILDEADPIEQSYCLEVGSPGLGRRLTRTSHFEQMAGRPVHVKLYAQDSAGRKELRGVLCGLEGDDVVLDTDYGRVNVPAKDAAWFKLCDDENLFN